MIFHKFWSAFVAQLNKVANIFWEADPIAQMRYEYDKAVEQLKEGRLGLEQYRGLVERVTRQVSANRSHVQKLEAETKAYLKAGDRQTAAKFALELQKAKEELAANDQQLQMHETAYGNSLQQDPAREREADRTARQNPQVRRRAQDERRGSRDRQALRDVRREPDDRFRRDRERHPAEDRSEPRQGARGGGSLAEGDCGDRRRGAYARRAGGAGAHELRDRAGAQVAGNHAGRGDGEGLGPATEKAVEKQTN